MLTKQTLLLSLIPVLVCFGLVLLIVKRYLLKMSININRPARVLFTALAVISTIICIAVCFGILWPLWVLNGLCLYAIVDSIKSNQFYALVFVLHIIALVLAIVL